MEECASKREDPKGTSPPRKTKSAFVLWLSEATFHETIMQLLRGTRQKKVADLENKSVRFVIQTSKRQGRSRTRTRSLRKQLPFAQKPIRTISGGFGINYQIRIRFSSSHFFERFEFWVCSKFNHIQCDSACACAVACLHTIPFRMLWRP